MKTSHKTAKQRKEAAAAVSLEQSYKVVIPDEPRFYAAFLLFERRLNEHCAAITLGDGQSISEFLNDDSTRALYQQFQVFKRMFHFQQVLFDE